MALHQTQDMRLLQGQVQLWRAHSKAWNRAIDMVIDTVRDTAITFMEERSTTDSPLARKLKPAPGKEINAEALHILVMAVAERIQQSVDDILMKGNFTMIDTEAIDEEINNALGYIITDKPTAHKKIEDQEIRSRLLHAHNSRLRRDEHFDNLINSGAELRELRFEDIPAVEDLYEEFILQPKTVGEFAAGLIERTDETFINHFKAYELHDMQEGLSNAKRKRVKRNKAPFMKGVGLWSQGGQLLGMTANKIWSPEVEKNSVAYREMLDFLHNGTSGGGMDYHGKNNTKLQQLQEALDAGKLLQLTLVMGKIRRAATLTMAGAYKRLGREKLVRPDSVAITYFLKRMHMKLNGESIHEGLDDLGANVSSQNLCGKFSYGEGGPFATDSNLELEIEKWSNYKMGEELILSIMPEWSHILTSGQRLLERADQNHI